MKRQLQILFKFKTLLLLNLISISLLMLFFGFNTQVNAQNVPEEEVEVLSIPPQEAYFIEDKTQEPLSPNDSTVYPEEKWDDRNTPVYPTDNIEENTDNPPTNSKEFN